MTSQPSGSGEPDIVALIARLEAATEGSRELDALIWVTILPRAGLGLDGYGLANGYHFAYAAHDDGTVDMFREDGVTPATIPSARRKSPLFTASLDAALTLVPEGNFVWAVSGSNPDGCDPRPLATIMPETGTWAECFAATPALALCIASLKIRFQP